MVTEKEIKKRASERRIEGSLDIKTLHMIHSKAATKDLLKLQRSEDQNSERFLRKL